jgi:hypothetical protein
MDREELTVSRICCTNLRLLPLVIVGPPQTLNGGVFRDEVTYRFVRLGWTTFTELKVVVCKNVRVRLPPSVPRFEESTSGGKQFSEAPFFVTRKHPLLLYSRKPSRGPLTDSALNCVHLL